MSLHPLAKGFEPESEVAVAKREDTDGVEYLFLFRFREDNSMINWCQIPWQDFLAKKWKTIILDPHDQETTDIYQHYKNFRVLIGIDWLPFDHWWRQQPMAVEFETSNGKTFKYRMTLDAWLTCERVFQRIIENPERYITEKQAIMNVKEAPHVIKDEDLKQDFSIN